MSYIHAASIESGRSDIQEGLAEAQEITRIYLAQWPFASALPTHLLADLPMPQIVSRAGKSDLYDSSLWLGVPPTYTPLHKDPNDNLFVQLAGTKVLRLMEKAAGEAVVREGRRRARVGEWRGLGIRWEEMMVGREREVTDWLVWEDDEGGGKLKVFEVEVQAGDACFIPRGWWHSIRGKETHDVDEARGIVCSVNWWFR